MKKILWIVVTILAATLAVGCRKRNCQIRYVSAEKIELSNFKDFGAEIESHKFKNGLGVITFYEPIMIIPEDAFSDCEYLKIIALPDGVTTIGEGAFASCTSLKRIRIPDSVTSIGYSAFDDCTSLTSVTIPNSVTSIKEEAFLNCI